MILRCKETSSTLGELVKQAKPIKQDKYAPGQLLWAS